MISPIHILKFLQQPKNFRRKYQRKHKWVFFLNTVYFSGINSLPEKCRKCTELNRDYIEK